MEKFATRLSSELAAAIAAATGKPGTTRPADPPAASDGWRVTFAAGERQSVLWIDGPGAAAAARAVLMLDEAPDEGAVKDMLAEIGAQAAGAVGQTEPFAGTKIAITTIEAGALPIDKPLAFVDVDFGDQGLLHLAFTAGMDPVAEPKAPPMPPPSPGNRTVATALESPNLDVVLDIELPLVVRFGRTVMTLKALSALGPGSIVDMGRSPDDPVELLVSERVIARGEVVIVGGNYGIRITDLVSAAERIRALEA